MEEILLKNEREIFTFAYFTAISLVAIWECVAPRRDGTQPLHLRWTGNIGITLIGIFVIQLIFPLAAVGFAIVIEANGLGLLRVVDTPVWIAGILGFIVLDFSRYILHSLLHRIPILWRLHRVHHADHDYDFSVGLRFHPIEGLVTTGGLFAVIALIGASPLIVAISELITVITAMAVHANGRTPQSLERYVRWFFVTPDMHRVHHSILPSEHNSNYSGLFSVWDRLFDTYVADPVQSHEQMEIGLPDLRSRECLKLSWMLISPFRKMTENHVSRTESKVGPASTSSANH